MALKTNKTPITPTKKSLTDAYMALKSVLKNSELGQQDFGDDDSLIISSLIHPREAAKKSSGWLQDQVKTAAGLPLQSIQDEASMYAYGPDRNTQLMSANNLAGLAQLGSMPGAPGSAGGTVGSITAWHGSPYKFDKFNSKFMGNGEGAQHYGKGHYLAQIPETAKFYKDKLIDGIVKYSGVNINSDEFSGNNPLILTNKLRELAINSNRKNFDKNKDVLINNLIESIKDAAQKEKFYSERLHSAENIDIYNEVKLLQQKLSKTADFIQKNVNSNNLYADKGYKYKAEIKWPDRIKEEKRILSDISQTYFITNTNLNLLCKDPNHRT